MPLVDDEEKHKVRVRDANPFDGRSTVLVSIDENGGGGSLLIAQSSSGSSDEVIFQGRIKKDKEYPEDRKDLRLSEALGCLSLIEKDKQRPEDHQDLKQMISKYWYPSPSEEYEAERGNHYPKIDMNAGWNRAIYSGREFLLGPPDISHIKVATDFAGYSLSSQRLILPVKLPATEESGQTKGHKSLCIAHQEQETVELQKLFHRVFNTTGLVQQPFHTCRSKVLARRIMRPANRSIGEPQSPHGSWRKSWGWGCNVPQTPPLLDPSRRKRCRSGHHNRNGRAKRQRRTRQDSQQGTRMALCDKWRKRMCERAVMQGRLTDGTHAQHGLWAQFHWVLDGAVEADPLRQRRAYEETETADCCC